MPDDRPEPRRYEPFAADGWRGLVRRDWADRLGAVDPWAWAESQPHRPVKIKRPAVTLRIEAGAAIVYIKHMSGANSRRDPVSRLKWLLRPSRALHTLRVADTMRERALAAPPTVLAARRRRRLEAEDVIITDAVEGVSLPARLDPADDATRARVLEQTAAEIAALHRAGFAHGDLLPLNLLVTPGDARIVFLDNDRTRIHPSTAPAAARHRNLVQFCARLARDRDVASLLDGYGRAMGDTNPRWPRDRAVIEQRIARRAASIEANRRKRGGRPSDRVTIVDERD